MGLTGSPFEVSIVMASALLAAMIGLLASNWVLADSPFYHVTLVGQFAFYTWAAAGFLLHDQLRGVRFALLGYFLVTMHLAFLVGLIKYLFVLHDGTWQRSG